MAYVTCQEDYEDDWIMKDSASTPANLDDVIRCLGVLESDREDPHWCTSLKIMLKLLNHMKESRSLGRHCCKA